MFNHYVVLLHPITQEIRSSLYLKPQNFLRFSTIKGVRSGSIILKSCLFLLDGLSNGVDSVVELLYLLCSTQDTHTEERVTAILSWLTVVTASQAHIASCKYVQCVGAILWANPGLSHLVTNDLFRYTINTAQCFCQVQLFLKVPG